MTDCACECSRSSNDSPSFVVWYMVHAVFWGPWRSVAFLSDSSTVCGSGSPHQLYAMEKRTHICSLALSLALGVLSISL